MKIKLLLIILLCAIGSFGQNLVVNPSFEITNSNCSNIPIPDEGFRSDLNPSWDNANSNIPGDSCSSPDLFSGCNTIATGMPNATNFGIGWQYSRTGTRHVGIIGYSAPFGFADNYREYIQGHTTTALVAGQSYCVSFYVSLADGCPYAIQDLSVYFSNTQYLRNACSQGSRINVTPQLNNTCGVISDTMNWIRLQWDYVATGGEQYFMIGNFNTDANTTKANANGSGFGNYFAYYFIDDVSITQNTCCAAMITPHAPVCETDAAFTLTATPPFGSNCNAVLNGTWSGSGISSNGTFTPSVAGTGSHTITFTLACGQSATTTIVVNSCQALTLCQEANGTLTVSNGTGPYTWEDTQPAGTTPITNQAQCTACGYSWNSFVGQCLNGFQPATSCNSPAGYAQFATGTNATPTTNFPIRVTDSQGNEIIINSLTGIPSCSANPCGTITVTSSGVTSASCSTGGSATVSASGGTGPYTYNWMPGNLNGASQTNLTAGTYTVTATDAASCTGTTTVTINSSGAVSLAISNQTNVACNGQSTGSATVSASGGTAPYTYTWSPGNLNGATQSNLAAGSYTVTASDAANCSSNVTVTITAPSALTTNTSTTPANCGIANGSATVQAQGGTSPYTYAWSPSGGNAATANNLNSGAYTVLVTDASGCTKTNNVNVPANGGPTLTIANQTNVGCSGAPTGSATITVQGGTAPYTYAWSPTGGNTASASNLSAGTYTLSVTDASNCVVSISVTITAANGPSVSIGNVTNVSCQGANNGSATANASGGTAPYSYAWSPSGGNAATASNLSAGTYTVTVTDASACTSTATTTISAGNSINLVETITPENCGADDGQINVVATGGNGNLTYTWTPNVSTTATATNLSSGSYSLTVSDGNGCSTTEQYTVGQVGGINVDVIPSVTTIFEGESVSILASGAVTYVWTPTNGLSCTTCPDPVASPSTTTTYVVTGTDANGCSGTDSVKIIVKPICGEVMVPTIFSPNGDNHNDFECVIGNCIVELEFSIYNRWGERVFFTDDQTICWDGTFKGKKVNSGTFVYKVYARIYDGSTFTENGNITVVE